MEYNQQEQLVRSLDDLSKPVSKLAGEISKNLNLSLQVCKNFLYAKRAGYNLYQDYRKDLAIAKGFHSENEARRFRYAQSKNGPDYTGEQFRAFCEEAFHKTSFNEYLRKNSIPVSCLINPLTKLEQEIRSLDNPELTLSASAKNISKKIDLKYNSCLKYISNFRGGFTKKSYADFSARKKGFIDVFEQNAYNRAKSKNNGLTLEEFREQKTKDKDFSLVENYVRFLEDKRLYFQNIKGKSARMPQNMFEYSCIEFGNPKKIYKSVPAKKDLISNSDNNEAFWKVVESSLTPRQWVVIYHRFMGEKTLDELGKEFNVTRERIRQIELKALKKLGHSSRIKILEELLR